MAFPYPLRYHSFTVIPSRFSLFHKNKCHPTERSGVDLRAAKAAKLFHFSARNFIIPQRGRYCTIARYRAGRWITSRSNGTMSSSFVLMENYTGGRMPSNRSSSFPSLSGGGGVGRDGDDDDRGLRPWDEGPASGEVHGIVPLGGKRRRRRRRRRWKQQKPTRDVDVSDNGIGHRGGGRALLRHRAFQGHR